MFDKLEDLLQRYEELQNELSDPNVVNDQARFRKLMKEQNDLADIVAEYKRYKQTKQDIEDSLLLLDEESDEESFEGYSRRYVRKRIPFGYVRSRFASTLQRDEKDCF